MAQTAVRALVLDAPRTLVERSLPMPSIGEDDGLLRVEACGLCGTDHELYTGTLPAGFAFVPGHESVGVVEAVGPKAAERWSVRVGDRVAVEVMQSCGACEKCLAGDYRLCRRHGRIDPGAALQTCAQFVERRPLCRKPNLAEQVIGERLARQRGA